MAPGVFLSMALFIPILPPRPSTLIRNRTYFLELNLFPRAGYIPIVHGRLPDVLLGVAGRTT